MPDRQTRALRRLLRLHLLQAQVLQLLDGRKRVELNAFSSMEHTWKRTATPAGTRFARAIEAAGIYFGANWRYRSVRQADSALVSRVIVLRDLKYSLRATKRKGRSVLSTLIKDFEALGTKLSLDAAATGAVTVLSDVERLLFDLRAEFYGAKLSPFVTLISAVKGPGSCWVSLPAPFAIPATTAQYWRDRLGLHHLPLGVTLGDRLVRVTFRVRLSTQPCPASSDELTKSRSGMPTEAWLVRPSVGDAPNPRFVQANLRDTPKLPAPTGVTIDLSSDAYDEAESELVVLHGRDAQLEWVDLELLDGFPEKHSRDDDHEAFVDLVENRHAHLLK